MRFTITELHEAVVGLLDKLDEVSDATVGIFQMAQIHGVTYRGPTYEKEYDLLRTLIGTDRPPRTPSGRSELQSERARLNAENEVAEVYWPKATVERFNVLRRIIKELAELEKEHRTDFRPSKAWLERMIKIEDECGGHISVGGLAADLGMLQKPKDPDTFLMMGGIGGEPMGTMSNPSLDDLIYYMKADGSTVRLLSEREAELADRCNTYDDCPAEDPDIVECPMHPELGG